MVSVGVDIGTYSIKVAEVEATSKSYVLRRVQEFPYSPLPYSPTKSTDLHIEWQPKTSSGMHSATVDASGGTP